MCRLVAYIGSETALENVVVAPPHSLLEQSQNATEAKLSVNGDGFGISWYGLDDEPGLYRDVLPAWSDGNLPSICRLVRSSLFLAHVRASTTGETSRLNCHPFTHQNWSFMHNGQIGNFRDKRRMLEALLPDDLYELRRGTTDSELLFLLLIVHGLKTEPLSAITKTITAINSLPSTSSQPNRLTCVFSNGERLFAFRKSCDGKSPTLYISKDANVGYTILASEPLDDRSRKWQAVPDNTFIEVIDKEHYLRPIASN